jgi:hypothetical protein
LRLEVSQFNLTVEDGTAIMNLRRLTMQTGMHLALLVGVCLALLPTISLAVGDANENGRLLIDTFEEICRETHGDYSAVVEKLQSGEWVPAEFKDVGDRIKDGRAWVPREEIGGLLAGVARSEGSAPPTQYCLVGGYLEQQKLRSYLRDIGSVHMASRVDGPLEFHKYHSPEDDFIIEFTVVPSEGYVLLKAISFDD